MVGWSSRNQCEMQTNERRQLPQIPGETKGGALETYRLLHTIPSLESVWQIHRSKAAGDQNFSNEQIANLDESTAHWIKVSARKDGSFIVTNGRTRKSQEYGIRRK
jgi:hypothetical protein